jgi:hypothetical protein
LLLLVGHPCKTVDFCQEQEQEQEQEPAGLDHSTASAAPLLHHRHHHCAVKNMVAQNIDAIFYYMIDRFK